MEEQPQNRVIIAEREYKSYIGDVISLCKTNDTILLSANEAYKEKMLYIADLLLSVGLVEDKGYKNLFTGKRQLQKEVITGYRNKKSGKIENVMIYKLGLIKIPELFMYTDTEMPKPASDVFEEVQEELIPKKIKRMR